MDERRQQNAISPLLIERLKRLFSTFQKTPADDSFIGYVEALSDLSDSEIELAFPEATRRFKFLPTPAEIRDALDLARERMPRIKLAKDDCELCLGDGWKVVEVNGRKFAVKCDCTKRSAA